MANVNNRDLGTGIPELRLESPLEKKGHSGIS